MPDGAAVILPLPSSVIVHGAPGTVTPPPESVTLTGKFVVVPFASENAIEVDPLATARRVNCPPPSAVIVAIPVLLEAAVIVPLYPATVAVSVCVCPTAVNACVDGLTTMGANVTVTGSGTVVPSVSENVIVVDPAPLALRVKLAPPFVMTLATLEFAETAEIAPLYPATVAVTACVWPIDVNACEAVLKTIGAKVTVTGNVVVAPLVSVKAIVVVPAPTAVTVNDVPDAGETVAIAVFCDVAENAPE